jgi:acetoin utilization deacetylase AcuC-like enzyme
MSQALRAMSALHWIVLQNSTAFAALPDLNIAQLVMFSAGFDGLAMDTLGRSATRHRGPPRMAAVGKGT